MAIYSNGEKVVDAGALYAPTTTSAASNYGDGAIVLNTTTYTLNTVYGGNYFALSGALDPSYTSGGNYVGDGSDG